MNDKMEPFVLFREKAGRLLSSTFAKEIEKPTGVDIKWTEDGQIAVHRGPSQEAVDAFVLTFRFFIQGNETISFRNMKENFKKNIDDKELHTYFEELVVALNAFLDGNTSFNVDGLLTRRQLMEIFLYGHLCHTNIEAKRNLYKSWVTHEFMAELMRVEFNNILGRVLVAIARGDRLCEKVIERHSSK